MYKNTSFFFFKHDIQMEQSDIYSSEKQENCTNNEYEHFNNVTSKKKLFHDIFEYETISPIFHWKLKIKHTKIELMKIILIKNNLFKSFIKKNNSTLKINFINNQYHMIKFFEDYFNAKIPYAQSLYMNGNAQNNLKKNVNLYENYQFILANNTTDKLIFNIINKNDKINCYQNEMLKDWYTYNLINFEITLLFLNTFVIKLNDLETNENNINDYINITNWKTYAWHTIKKFK